MNANRWNLPPSLRAYFPILALVEQTEGCWRGSLVDQLGFPPQHSRPDIWPVLGTSSCGCDQKSAWCLLSSRSNAGLAEAVSPEFRQEGDDPVDGGGVLVWAEPQLAVVMVEAYKFGGRSGQRDPVGGADGQRIGSG